MKSVTHSEKESFWRAELALFDKFSGSGSEFCRSRSLSFYQFRYWMKRLGKAGAGKALAMPAFIPVDVSEPKHTPPPLPDPRWLAELVAHLCGTTR